MNIYITGVAGFIGSNLADKLISLGHSVSGCDNLLGGFEHNIPDKVNFYNLDCTDLDKLSDTMHDIDIVYHCAAAAHDGLSVFSPVFITNNIYTGTASTVTAAINNNVKRFVYCSSMSRYGKCSIPYHENFTPEPTSPYGIAKLASEKLVQTLAHIHNFEYNIAVPHNVIGPKQCYIDPYRNVVSIMINRILLGKKPIVYGDGNQKRCFSYIDDCIDSLTKLGLNNISNEIFNIGPDEETVTINEIVDIISSELNYSGGVIYMPARPGEIKDAICSSNKAKEILNYKTQTSLLTAIKNTILYIQKMGAKEFVYKYPLEIIRNNIPTTWKEKII